MTLKDIILSLVILIGLGWFIYETLKLDYEKDKRNRKR